MKSIITLALAAFLAVGCNTSQTGSNTGENKDTVPTVSEPKPKEAILFCTSLGEKEPGIPLYEVSLMYDEMPTLLDTVNACAEIDAKDWASMGIPAKAVSAVGGWFAGGGDYFYVIPYGAGVQVFKGWQDEAQEDQGYHWAPFQF